MKMNLQTHFNVPFREKVKFRAGWCVTMPAGHLQRNGAAGVHINLQTSG